MINSRSDSTGKRRSQALSLSAEGAAVLRKWIFNLSEEMGCAGIDPIRARVNYLAALEPDAQTKFLDRAEEVTRSRLELARASKGDPEAKHSWTLQATAKAVVYQLEARLRWLGDLRGLIHGGNR